MSLDWNALGEVFAVSVGVTVGVVVIFALGILGLARVEAAREVDGGTHALGLRQGCAFSRVRLSWRTAFI